MNTKKIVISIIAVVAVLSTALTLGTIDFDSKKSANTVKAEISTIKSIESMQIQKSENKISLLGETPMDKAFAKANEQKKAKAKALAAKKAKKLAKIKKAKAKKAKIRSQYKKLGTFNASAYCGCASCCGSAGGHTASGTTPRAGRTIATDPSVIPLGSKVLIDGKEYVAEDTGGAIGGKRIDIFFSSHSEALQFGRRSVEVSIKK
ncbi:MAG: 3D domain-containing protein [Eubacterium sp.]|nr:3D domain-containing protein [Eubacterium sp.]